VHMPRAALRYIGTLHHMNNAVNTQRDYMDWCYGCSDFLNSVSHSPSAVRNTSFFVACIAAGDVCFPPPRLRTSATSKPAEGGATALGVL
jgi:hypothetical protein